MRKISLMLLVAIAILFACAPALADNSTVNLRINGHTVFPEAPPFIQDGRTLVPLRFIGDACGMQVAWDDTLRRVTVAGQNDILLLDIGSAIAYVNGEAVQMDVAAQIRESRTMVPLRFIMENLKAQVTWDDATRTVNIDLPSVAQPEPELELEPEPEVEPAPAKAGRISGYYFDSSSWDMLASHHEDFDTVINFAYKVFTDGSVANKNYNSGWNAYAEPLLNEQGIEKLLLITDFGDPPNGGVEGSVQMLSDPDTRIRAVANIANLVWETGATGVDIDFEKLTVAARDNFTAFINELKSVLGDKLVTISLPPKRSDNETWLDKFDYAALGQAADRLHIMFYDQHHGGSEPGPIASPAWMRQGLEYLSKQVPKEKIHVMLGAYGRAWGGEIKGTSVHLPRVTEIIGEFGAIQHRDEASSVPYLLYKDKNGNDMQLWYEDAASLGDKAALAREYGVGGIGLWRMGIVPDKTWQGIVDSYRGNL